MDPVPKPIPFVARDPEYYRHVACYEDDVNFLRACLLLAADDIDRWRAALKEENGHPLA